MGFIFLTTKFSNSYPCRLLQLFHLCLLKSYKANVATTKEISEGKKKKKKTLVLRDIHTSSETKHHILFFSEKKINPVGKA